MQATGLEKLMNSSVMVTHSPLMNSEVEVDVPGPLRPKKLFLPEVCLPQPDSSAH